MEGMGMGGMGGRRRKVDNDRFYELLVSVYDRTHSQKKPPVVFLIQLT